MPRSKLIKAFAKAHGVEAFMARPLGRRLRRAPSRWPSMLSTLAEQGAQFKPIYGDDLPLSTRSKPSRAKSTAPRMSSPSKIVRDQLEDLGSSRLWQVPDLHGQDAIFSFSTDPNAQGRAESITSIPMREVRLSAGAEFIVVVCGEIMTMPGLPKVPSADSIDVGADGQIVGLF